MGRHKVLNKVGELLVSFIDENGINHELISISYQQTCARRKIDASLLFVPPENTWNSCARPKIRKMVMGKHDTPFDKVIGELAAFYNERGKCMIAVKMKLGDGRLETWLNPQILEKLGEIKAARDRVSAIANNGGTGLNFFSKTLRMLEADAIVDFGERPERLQIEFDNFSKPFPLTW
ncbi:MAG: hypothetical protein ABSF24_02420 [Candidatus Bathyarchaeia archaeon]